MPQLNPGPWFMILIFSWLVFSAVIPPKIMSHLFPNEPNSMNNEASKTTPWTWRWQ